MKHIENTDKKNGLLENRRRTPLADAMDPYRDENRVSFHVPGHKGSDYSSALINRSAPETLRSDLTELPGLDDLHHPTGVIARAEQLAAGVFGAEDTFFLVNGTSSGIVAAIASVSSEGETVILERHTHECTTRGLILSGATPYYVANAFDQELGVFTDISIEAVTDALGKCNSPAAVVLTHPSYYGTYSDICAITEVAHQAGAVVIADEAHGAQLAFTEQRQIPSALEAGADIVVQSTHKMLGSLTQSSMLHVRGARVNRDSLRYYISFMNSTSPSYLLMSSLDRTRAFVEEQGRETWQRIAGLVRNTRERLNRLEGIHCPVDFSGKDGQRHELEGSRLLLSAWEHGLTGMELQRILAVEYGIDVEFSGFQYAVALAGTGSTENDFERLLDAMKEIAQQPVKTMDPLVLQQLKKYREAHRLRFSADMTPRQAVKARTLRLSGILAEGMVSARDISLYPPGIPVIRTGEVFTHEILEYIETAHQYGMEFHGTAGFGEDGDLRFFCAEDPHILDLMNGFF